ncbi:CHRD domain-containing protein [Massilia sp. R2A-15]|uniref:CHRD domain-containing protein n=1 Tax=Massilia sp. R2A-15 TaxID=3064278 RepID=UPI002736FF24|nr:CHRD domain-containing protein [Massilia sp. R2A-15]WLI87567.1 CHRD domain-containing protein [Massilia sp. R2A-15]
MKTVKKDVRVAGIAAVAAMLALAGCDSMKAKDASPPMAVEKTATAINPTPMPNATPAPMPAAMPAAAPMMLSGAQEVPPNPSTASGKSMIMIGADKSVTGSVEVMGMTPTMAHIHEAAKGQNGPVIVPFTKTGANTFAPAPGAKLTDAQYASYMAGNLYINVHSATYPGGEVRMQLWPAK